MKWFKNLFKKRRKLEFTIEKLYKDDWDGDIYDVKPSDKWLFRVELGLGTMHTEDVKVKGFQEGLGSICIDRGEFLVFVKPLKSRPNSEQFKELQEEFKNNLKITKRNLPIREVVKQ